MIRYSDAIAVARSLIGTPYSELDCINMIKRVIRTAPGGVPSYTTAGTNSLWESYDKSAKYKDLTWRQESIANARAGMIAFKRYGADDEGHAGIVTDVGTVIHASSVYGSTVETPLTASQGWDLLAIHRYIDVARAGEEQEETMLYQASVRLADERSSLNIRSAPVSGAVIGRLSHGQLVDVLAEENGWALVRYAGGASGYVSQEFLVRVQDSAPDESAGAGELTIIDSENNTFSPVGDWRVTRGSVD